MSKFIAMSINSLEPEEDAPDKDRVIFGSPQFKSWSLDEAAGGLSSGIWEATPGKWRFENTHWEYCRIHSGVSVVTEDGGAVHTVRAGDAFIMRAGFKGTWEVIETTRKDYVIRY
jgi:uncharacterized cupin superfamily protein